MTLKNVLKLIILISLFACNSKPRENKTSELHENSKNEFFLSGSWIYHDSARFELIEIKDTNEVLYFGYTNRKKATGIDDEDWFYKSKAKISVFKAKDSWLEKCGLLVFEPDDRIISLQTDKYRFDYAVRKDTLIEFDKMGIQKKLVRLKEDKN
jgi:hypothetical protein